MNSAPCKINAAADGDDLAGCGSRALLARLPRPSARTTTLYGSNKPIYRLPPLPFPLAWDIVGIATNIDRLRQLETRLKAGVFWEEHDYVFCTLVGTHLRPSYVVDEFKKLLKKANLPDIRFHDIRHSAATLLLSLGIHPKVVQEMLGHTQISMTMDIYSHVLPSMQQDAVSKLNDLLMRHEE